MLVIRNHICYCPIEFILRDVFLHFYMRLTFPCVEDYVEKNWQNRLRLGTYYFVSECSQCSVEKLVLIKKAFKK